MSTPMSTTMALDPHENGETVDQREYRSMTDSLLYLTVTRLDIQFAMCPCAHFQASPLSSHRTAI
jgi:hypothetical protein